MKKNEPHVFVRRWDGACKVCKLRESDPIHAPDSGSEPKAIDAKERKPPKKNDATVNAHLLEKKGKRP